MTESYPNAEGNRARESVRGIPRPFSDFGYADFVQAFDSTIGAKSARSEGENALVLKAEKFCRILVKFPGIRRIWVCNSLSMNAADGDSDIDLFIETAAGMLWTGRVMATMFFSLLWVRRHGNYVKGRFCLSFFAVENVDFGKIAIEDDAYLYEWAKRLVSVDGKGAGEGLPENSPVQENQSERHGTGSSHKNVLDRRESDDSNEMLAPVCGLFSSADDRRFRPRMRWISAKRKEKTPWGAFSNGELSGSPTGPSLIARMVERTFKKLFLGKTLREYERLGKPWGIVISDEFLKFHPEDRRIEIRGKVRGRLGRSE